MAQISNTSRTPMAERSVFWQILIAALGVTVLIAIVIAFSSDPDSSAENAIDAAGSENIDQRPTGAGTKPDGAADTVVEGIEESTDGSEIVAPADAAEGSDAAQAPADGADAAAEGADPIEAENETTDLVIDPDDGQPGEPDGGAEPFYPTPAGNAVDQP